MYIYICIYTIIYIYIYMYVFMYKYLYIHIYIYRATMALTSDIIVAFGILHGGPANDPGDPKQSMEETGIQTWIG